MSSSILFFTKTRKFYHTADFQITQTSFTASCQEVAKHPRPHAASEVVCGGENPSNQNLAYDKSTPLLTPQHKFREATRKYEGETDLQSSLASLLADRICVPSVASYTIGKVLYKVPYTWTWIFQLCIAGKVEY